MTRIRAVAMATLLAILAACATPPPEAPPQAQAPRDLLVELGDAEAAGDRDAMLRLAAELMAEPSTDMALQQDLADLMAREGNTAGALAAYEQLANAENRRAGNRTGRASSISKPGWPRSPPPQATPPRPRNMPAGLSVSWQIIWASIIRAWRPCSLSRKPMDWT
jgi:hypothetical protein